MHSVWTDVGLFSLHWDAPETKAVATNSSGQERIGQLDRCLERFFDSGRETFEEIVIDGSEWTDFTARVYQRCRSIRPATTLTYKQLAAAAGSEKASRAVGAAMSRNRILLVIPCHRVVAGGGDLRGFSAPGGLTTKRMLLNLEQNRAWPALA
jgi:methylated-DNA-[protein]-cysteine S-methyltransferase